MLDSVGYLTSLGWEGKGSGLREGSASRPLAIPKKRTLAGLGKDRDEAFPFWDHVFSAAAKSIKIKISDDEEGETTADSSSQTTLLRTTTGILSNRRPVSLTPGTSGTATPTEQEPLYAPRLSLMAIAKRDTARKRLYASFFRGPVLDPEIDSSQSNASLMTGVTGSKEIGNSGVEMKHNNVEGLTKNPSERSKKGRQKDITLLPDGEHTLQWKKKKRKISSETHMAPEIHIEAAELGTPARLETKDEKRDRKVQRRKQREERRIQKEERRRARAERRQRKEAKREAAKPSHA
ncbi:hypothetical protein BU17DRAFT_61596 [Hysterangium stoloniferum]|nr:hypothetical protein BU17DRAFT_61596 [Hysterangium stoloniferum]